MGEEVVLREEEAVATDAVARDAVEDTLGELGIAETVATDVAVSLLGELGIASSESVLQKDMAIGVTLAETEIGENTDDESIWDVATDLITDDSAPEFETDVDLPSTAFGVTAVVLDELVTAMKAVASDESLIVLGQLVTDEAAVIEESVGVVELVTVAHVILRNSFQQFLLYIVFLLICYWIHKDIGCSI